MARFIENITEIKKGYDNDSFIAFLQDEDNKFPWEYHCIKLDLPDNRVNEKIFCECMLVLTIKYHFG